MNVLKQTILAGGFTIGMLSCTNDKKVELQKTLATDTTKASFYGTPQDGFIGKRMANGKRMNPNALAAAHKTRPMGTIVRVIENDSITRTSDTIVIKITDRMPFTKSNEGRSIDLTPKAFEAISDTTKGHVKVILEVLKRGKKKTKKSKKKK